MLKSLLKLTDQILNFLLIPYQKIGSSRIMKDGPNVEYLNFLSPELLTFIEIHSQNEFSRRLGTDLEWIMQYPWIKKKADGNSFSSVEYPFSHLVKNFEQYFVKITESGQTIGLLFISVRDGHMRVPYAYFQEKDGCRVLKVIYQQAVLKKVVTLTVFCPKLVSLMNSATHPFIFKKKIKRLIAISKHLSSFYQQYPEIQDGDGDVVFT